MRRKSCLPFKGCYDLDTIPLHDFYLNILTQIHCHQHQITALLHADMLLYLSLVQDEKLLTFLL